MRLNSFRKALVILALALSQWLVAAHVLQHSALAQEQVCQICLHAQGLDSGAVSLALPTISLPQQIEQIADLPTAPALQVAVTSYPIRGPPSLLV
jgi:hypothetical protein